MLTKIRETKQKVELIKVQKELNDRKYNLKEIQSNQQDLQLKVRKDQNSLVRKQIQERIKQQQDSITKLNKSNYQKAKADSQFNQLQVRRHMLDNIVENQKNAAEIKRQREIHQKQKEDLNMRRSLLNRSIYDLKMFSEENQIKMHR